MYFVSSFITRLFFFFDQSPTSGQLRLLIQGCLLEIQDPNSVLNSGNTKIWENFQDKACHGVYGPSEVKVAKSCPTLCNAMEYIVHGTLQARILEWVSYPLGNLPNSGIEPGSSALWADSLPAELLGKPYGPKPLPVEAFKLIFLQNQVH